jgi:cytochrome c biogenesis protein CcdA
MKRAARSLVERRIERFESRHGLDESRERLREALSRARIAEPWPFEARWTDAPGQVVLEATYEPSQRTRAFLMGLSLGFTALLATSVWAVTRTSEGSLRFLMPMFTLLAVLGFPFVTLALASNRDALESRVRKAIRAALLDEDERFVTPGTDHLEP